MYKIYVSNDELNALLYLYYGVIKGLDNNKGLSYKHCFKFQQLINKNINYIKKNNINIYDYIDLEVNENVN